MAQALESPDTYQLLCSRIGVEPIMEISASFRRASNASTKLGPRFSVSRFLNDNDAVCIGASLRSDSFVVELDLSNQKIGDKGVASLAAALQVNACLRVLRLAHNAIADTGATALGTALGTNETLSELDLSHNNISASGAEVIAAGLDENSALRVLNLSHNRLGSLGATAIASTITSNTSLIDLSIADNGIGEEGCTALADALKLNQGLIRLNLQGLQESGQGFVWLCKGLQVNRTLRQLFLTVESGDHPRLSALASCLEVNPSVVSLSLRPDQDSIQVVRAEHEKEDNVFIDRIRFALFVNQCIDAKARGIALQDIPQNVANAVASKLDSSLGRQFFAFRKRQSQLHLADQKSNQTLDSASETATFTVADKASSQISSHVAENESATEHPINSHPGSRPSSTRSSNGQVATVEQSVAALKALKQSMSSVNRSDKRTGSAISNNEQPRADSTPALIRKSISEVETHTLPRDRSIQSESISVSENTNFDEVEEQLEMTRIKQVKSLKTLESTMEQVCVAWDKESAKAERKQREDIGISSAGDSDMKRYISSSLQLLQKSIDAFNEDMQNVQKTVSRSFQICNGRIASVESRCEKQERLLESLLSKVEKLSIESEEKVKEKLISESSFKTELMSVRRSFKLMDDRITELNRNRHDDLTATKDATEVLRERIQTVMHTTAELQNAFDQHMEEGDHSVNQSVKPSDMQRMVSERLEDVEENVKLLQDNVNVILNRYQTSLDNNSVTGDTRMNEKIQMLNEEVKALEHYLRDKKRNSIRSPDSTPNREYDSQFFTLEQKLEAVTQQLTVSINHLNDKVEAIESQQTQLGDDLTLKLAALENRYWEGVELDKTSRSHTCLLFGKTVKSLTEKVTQWEQRNTGATVSDVGPLAERLEHVDKTMKERHALLTRRVVNVQDRLKIIEDTVQSEQESSLRALEALVELQHEAELGDSDVNIPTDSTVRKGSKSTR
eukprot:GILK01013753.1.p1 GENE.GILK01013753.1~~GILK01013753.1.p1  ORF type:complete len:965 (-),score=229.59 GILK01013753.1:164-3058(-)